MASTLSGSSGGEGVTRRLIQLPIHCNLIVGDWLPSGKSQASPGSKNIRKKLRQNDYKNSLPDHGKTTSILSDGLLLILNCAILCFSSRIYP